MRPFLPGIDTVIRQCLSQTGAQFIVDAGNE